MVVRVLISYIKKKREKAINKLMSLFVWRMAVRSLAKFSMIDDKNRARLARALDLPWSCITDLINVGAMSPS